MILGQPPPRLSKGLPLPHPPMASYPWTLQPPAATSRATWRAMEQGSTSQNTRHGLYRSRMSVVAYLGLAVVLCGCGAGLLEWRGMGGWGGGGRRAEYLISMAPSKHELAAVNPPTRSVRLPGTSGSSDFVPYMETVICAHIQTDEETRPWAEAGTCCSSNGDASQSAPVRFSSVCTNRCTVTSMVWLSSCHRLQASDPSTGFEGILTCGGTNAEVHTADR